MLRSSLRVTRASSKSHSPRHFYSKNALVLAHDNGFSSSTLSSSPGKPQGQPPKMNGEDEHVSDQEWELRTGKLVFVGVIRTDQHEGRAMDILQQTLPTFFNTGLVATNYHLPLHIHGLLGATYKGKERAEERECDTCSEEGIYARTVRLEYTPPVALPAPLPRMLKVEGLPLYVASSVFLRHGMYAFYTDLAVAIHKVQILQGGPPRNSISPDSKPRPAPSDNTKASGKRNRERAIKIGFLVSGAGRLGLGKERAEWDVSSTYSFSPLTGRIILHTVNAIHPAPSETVYAAFQSTLSTLGSGFGPGGQKGAMNVARSQTPR